MVAFTVGLAALVLPLWAVTPSSLAQRLDVAISSAVVALFAFHFVAAGAPSACLVLAVILPLAHIGWLRSARLPDA
jgi:hypothetical protein